MSGHSEVEVKKQVTLYLRVFFALMALTVVTVAISYVHMPILLGVAVALFIACIKASLVAAFFMHLSTEKKIIIFILILTVFFFAFLLATPSLHHT